MLPSQVIKGARDLILQGWSWSHRLEVYVGDPKHEQVVHVRTSSKSRKSVESEPSLVTVLDLLRIDILNCKSQLDIVDCFLAIIPPQIFYLETSCFIGFSKSSHLVSFNFSLYLFLVLVIYMNSQIYERRKIDRKITHTYKAIARHKKLLGLATCLCSWSYNDFIIFKEKYKM